MPPAKKVKKGAPPWMATFSDMCTLLLTFFVLLLSFATMDVIKFKEMLGSVQKALGVPNEIVGRFQPVAADPNARLSSRDSSPLFTPSTPRDIDESNEMAAQVDDFIRNEGLSQDVAVSKGPRGVRLRVKGKLLFEPGEAEVKQSAEKLLSRIAQVATKFNYYLVVEGHTDSTPISTPKFPSNWELSGARAAAVLRYVVTQGVNPSMVSAVGFASNYPLASNDSAEGREHNRRVEFVFTKSPPRIAVD